MNPSIEKLATPGEIESLLIRARATASKAYAPYSKFSVGAVLVDRDGNEFIGCNVENASYGITLCAERVAGTAAISQGSRSWSKLVIVSPTGVSPCGACRQFLMEFAPALEIWFGGLDDSIPVRRASLSSLLPDAIAMSDLPSMRSS